MQIDTAIRQTTERLADISDSARLDAEILLARAIDVPRSYLFAHPDDTLDDAAVERLAKTTRRRIAGEPMAYITGSREFWSLDIIVSPATLVPRPDTEVLVERALREIPRKAEWEILDLGTGSGAIALAIAHDRPNCHVTATDISPDALTIAAQNARHLDIANIAFLEGNWTDPLEGRSFDMIVSNPPYVPSGDEALRSLQHEPLKALVAGDDGLAAIRILARDCRPLLKPEGHFLVEHGADQRETVASILEVENWTSIECHTDLAGRPRVTSARQI